jgi:hypothetical protein
MDANKKYLYFNTDSGDQDNARSFPVSSLVAIDIENNNTTQIKLLFKEAVQTDTTDIKLSRTTNSKDPRDFMEHLINEINFGKDATIVVADDSVGQYIHPDIDGVDTISAADYDNPTIKLGSHVHVFEETATDPGDKFDTGTYSVDTGSVGMINGEVITTIFFDMGDLVLTNHSTAAKVIGKAGGGGENASITKITEAKNGVVYGAEIICVETPAGTGTTTDLDIIATTDDLTTDEAVSGDNLLIGGNAIAKGDVIRSAEGATQSFAGMDNHFLYLATGNAPGSDGTYTAGKFILRLFGAPTVNLNDIS